MENGSAEPQKVSQRKTDGLSTVKAHADSATGFNWLTVRFPQACYWPACDRTTKFRCRLQGQVFLE